MGPHQEYRLRHGGYIVGRDYLGALRYDLKLKWVASRFGISAFFPFWEKASGQMAVCFQIIILRGGFNDSIPQAGPVFLF